jgi:hypothetical protein
VSEGLLLKTLQLLSLTDISGYESPLSINSFHAPGSRRISGKIGKIWRGLINLPILFLFLILRGATIPGTGFNSQNGG